VVIPTDIRERLELRPGQKLEVIPYDRRIELLPVCPIPEMRGFLPGLDSDVPREEDRHDAAGSRGGVVVLAGPVGGPSGGVVARSFAIE
jgi:AbrB family looped-hinge helix DNA binding protein